MLKTVNCTEYLKNKLSIKSIFSWLNGRAVEQLNSSISVKLFNLSTIKLKNLFTTHYSKFTKKVFAFTLAETLIVMGVIGVVAALTLPNLNQSTGNKEKVVKLQKLQTTLDDMIGRAVVTYGPYKTWSGKRNDFGIRDRLSDFAKISKMCTTVQDTDCYMNNGAANSNESSRYGFVLADGTAVGFVNHYTDPTDTNVGGGGFNIIVDLDGTGKGPNEDCKDRFVFYYDDSRGVRPDLDTLNISDGTSYSTNKCTAWVITNGNMDYLKCSDLKFGTKTTCK